MNLKERIERSLEEVVEKEGFELVELSVLDRGHKTLVRVFADRPTGGISLDECAHLSGRLSDWFDLENVFERAYVLEVSSPGLNRFLTSPRDFGRKVGKILRIWFQKGEGTQEASGQLLAVLEDGLLMQTERNREQKFPFDALVKGKEILKF